MLARLSLSILSLFAAACAHTPPPLPVPEAERLDAALTAAAAHDRFCGAALLARDGEVVLRKAYGPVDEAGTPATPETLYNVGSVGKLFTQVLVLEAVEQGRLSLDDTIARHWPDSGLPNADRITLRQLLSHTSGYGNYFEHEDYSLAQREIDEFLELVRTADPEFAPGEGFAYSNSAFWVLARILERTDPEERSWEELFDEEVFARAGMTSVQAFQPDEDPAARPQPFELRADGKVEPVFDDPRPGPDGGWYASVDDLLAFSQAITRGEWFGPQTYAASIEPVAYFDSMSADVGLVWELHDDNGRRYVTKGGTTDGGGAELVRFRHDGHEYTLAMLSNLGNAPLMIFKPALSYALADPGARLPGPSPEVALYQAALAGELPATEQGLRQWAARGGVELDLMPMLLAANQLRKDDRGDAARQLLGVTLELYPGNPIALRILQALD